MWRQKINPWYHRTRPADNVGVENIQAFFSEKATQMPYKQSNTWADCHAESMHASIRINTILLSYAVLQWHEEDLLTISSKLSTPRLDSANVYPPSRKQDESKERDIWLILPYEQEYPMLQIQSNTKQRCVKKETSSSSVWHLEDTTSSPWMSQDNRDDFVLWCYKISYSKI